MPFRGGGTGPITATVPESVRDGACTRLSDTCGQNEAVGSVRRQADRSGMSRARDEIECPSEQTPERILGSRRVGARNKVVHHDGLHREWRELHSPPEGLG